MRGFAIKLRTEPRPVTGQPDDRIHQEILLVEDQRSLAIVAAKMLHDRWGCHVLIATTVDQVRQIIAQGRHDFFIAVSDLNLPDGHDGEVIDVLIGAGIRTIAVTGAFDRSRLDNFLVKGVVDYVLKNSINAYEYIVELAGRLYKNTRIKVLIAEDAKDYREVLASQLARQCLQVVVAGDGAEALKILEQQDDIKLVLADYHMPVMDGFNLLAAIRRTHAKDDLCVIGMSSTEDPSISAQFLKLGGNDFLPKPFTYEELVCRISHNLQMLESIEKIRYVANHDALTGQLNRRAFFEQGNRRFDAATKSGKSLCVAMMDIDFFKRVNDTHGHDGGDAVLRHFSALLDEHFSGEIVGRLGGEEFALVLHEDADRATELCEGFREKIAATPARFGDLDIPMTVSIGFSRGTQTSLEAALTHADKNLYKAKESGRNRLISS